MSKVVSFIFEILRLCILLVLTLYILGMLERSIYQWVFGEPLDYWSMGVGNILVFFVLYRNYFQFKGWYKSENNQKLSKNTTIILVLISLILILIPIWL